jgi:hypothetical protein
MGTVLLHPRTQNQTGKLSEQRDDRHGHEGISRQGSINWDELLPEAAVALNTAKQSSTGLTPFEILYGWKAELPHERLFPWPEEKENLIPPS